MHSLPPVLLYLSAGEEGAAAPSLKYKSTWVGGRASGAHYSYFTACHCSCPAAHCEDQLGLKAVSKS